MGRQREENMSKAVKDREPPANHQPREGQAGGRGWVGAEGRWENCSWERLQLISWCGFYGCLSFDLRVVVSTLATHWNHWGSLNNTDAWTVLLSSTAGLILHPTQPHSGLWIRPGASTIPTKYPSLYPCFTWFRLVPPKPPLFGFWFSSFRPLSPLYWFESYTFYFWNSDGSYCRFYWSIIYKQ